MQNVRVRKHEAQDDTNTHGKTDVFVPEIRLSTDVLVVGAGLAGICAALSAAAAGVSVTLVSRGHICAGSSFYPGTWGLGLVGPENEEDIPDLERTILDIGEGVADESLVHTLAVNIADSIRWLEDLGIPLKRAVHKSEKAFIPCFDHKVREWHGLEKEKAAPVFRKKLAGARVRMLEHVTVIQLLKAEGTVRGVLAADQDGRLMCIHSHAVVLASGGMGGLFAHCLNTSDVRASGQYLALMAGAGLVNLEFMQMMPGFVKPSPKTIYNEKLFSETDFSVEDRPLFADWTVAERKARMEVRSTHGPFTSRLVSGKVDMVLYEAFLTHPEGIKAVYQDSLRVHQPEFVQTYFEWLEKEKHLTVDDPVWLGIFAHASNGGIRIGTGGETAVPGLYACGEVTGGMHGADRMGGLSTANGLVFGRLAGSSAAAYICRKRCLEPDTDGDFKTVYVPVIEGAAEALYQIRLWNSQSAMIMRSRRSSQDMLEKLAAMAEALKAVQKTFAVQLKPGGCLTKHVKASDITATMDLMAALYVSAAMHQAILMRTESRGSHYRTDFPGKSVQMAKPLVSRLNNGRIETEFL